MRMITLILFAVTMFYTPIYASDALDRLLEENSEAQKGVPKAKEKNQEVNQQDRNNERNHSRKNDNLERVNKNQHVSDEDAADPKIILIEGEKTYEVKSKQRSSDQSNDKYQFDEDKSGDDNNFENFAEKRRKARKIENLNKDIANINKLIAEEENNLRVAKLNRDSGFSIRQIRKKISQLKDNKNNLEKSLKKLKSQGN